MSSTSADPGSFRDPGGRVFIRDGQVLRAIYEAGAPTYEAVRDSGLYCDLVERGWLVAIEEIEPNSDAAGEGARYLLKHERLPFLSYPYEWSFSQLRRAAIFQLDILLDALARGFTLSDATAYNVQFVGSELRFIDHLSFTPYREGEIWAAHRQFCMQYLNPLILWSRRGVAPNSWFRGSLEGISPEELAPLLRWRDRFSLTIASHVVAQASIQRRANAGALSSSDRVARRLSRNAFKAMLMQLRDFIGDLKHPGGHTVWESYSCDNSYNDDTAKSKHRFVAEMVKCTQPKLLFDLGCNTGDYSVTALQNGARYVVGFDFDFGALDQAVDRATKKKLPLLPLWLDATNPSPSQGWNQQERRGFADRARGDAIIALAFIHHLAIARNIPLGSAVEWIMSIAPVGVIEFPPKSDPMVQQLLSRRDDIFPGFTEEAFLAEVRKRGRIIATEHLSAGGRLMLWYDRQ